MVPIVAPPLSSTVRTDSSREVPATTPWEERYSRRTHGMTSSVIRELLKLTEKPDVISFAGGLPAPEVFPRAEVAAAVAADRASRAEAALQYGTTEGYPPLRELFVRHMAALRHPRRGRERSRDVGLAAGARPDRRLLVNPGDRILTEEPTYLGALQAWRRPGRLPDGADRRRRPRASTGSRRSCAAGPKFLYVLPNFQNPGGTTLSLDAAPASRRAREPLRHADRRGRPVRPAPLRGRAPPAARRARRRVPRLRGGRAAFTGNVIYLSTFSKTLAPGLRIAWVVAPESVDRGSSSRSSRPPTCTRARSPSTWRTRWRTDGFLDRHVKRLRAVYGERRDAMLAALERHFPPASAGRGRREGCSSGSRRRGGRQDGAAQAGARAREGRLRSRLGLLPGGGGAHESMRLNFSYAPPDVIEEGIRRLGRVLARALSRRA